MIPAVEVKGFRLPYLPSILITVEGVELQDLRLLAPWSPSFKETVCDHLLMLLLLRTC